MLRRLLSGQQQMFAVSQQTVTQKEWREERRAGNSQRAGQLMSCGFHGDRLSCLCGLRACLDFYLTLSPPPDQSCSHQRPLMRLCLLTSDL